MPEPDDQVTRWIRQARAGSSEALGDLLQSCRGFLLQIARAELDPRLHAKGGASDLVQETFLEAQRDFHAFQGDSETDLLAWLRQRLRFRVAKFVRTYRQTAKRAAGREVRLQLSSSRAVGNEPVANQASPSEHVLADERDRAIEDLLERLPEEYRLVLRLRYREGLGFDAIGAALGRTPNAARKLWARAVEQIRHDLGTPGSS
jgi:RNA polymerase sigma-70 factor (ECF subfamily)